MNTARGTSPGVAGGSDAARAVRHRARAMMAVALVCAVAAEVVRPQFRYMLDRHKVDWRLLVPIDLFTLTSACLLGLVAALLALAAPRAVLATRWVGVAAIVWGAGVAVGFVVEHEMVASAIGSAVLAGAAGALAVVSSAVLAAAHADGTLR